MKNLSSIQMIWDRHQEQLEQTRILHLELLRKVNIGNAKSKLQSLTVMAAITLLFYQAAMWFFIWFTFQYSSAPQFLISGSLLAIWSGIISYGAIAQLQLILSIDYSEPIVVVQKSLQRVKIAIIHFLRMALMVLPFWLAFAVVFAKLFFNVDFIQQADPMWMMVQSIVLLVPAFWIYKNVSPGNAEKKWLNWLLQGNGSQINDAGKLLQEIEMFEKQP